MTTVTIKVYVYESDYGNGKHYVAYNSDKMADRWSALIGPAQFSYTIPPAFNSTAARIAALQAERDKAAKEFADTVRKIDQRISELTAIEYSEAA